MCIPFSSTNTPFRACAKSMKALSPLPGQKYILSTFASARVKSATVVAENSCVVVEGMARPPTVMCILSFPFGQIQILYLSLHFCSRPCTPLADCMVFLPSLVARILLTVGLLVAAREYLFAIVQLELYQLCAA